MPIVLSTKVVDHWMATGTLHAWRLSSGEKKLTIGVVATIDVPWRKFSESRVSDKVTEEVPLFLDIPEFSYATT